MNERRTRGLLIVLLVGQLFMLTSQLPDPGGGGGSRLEAVLLRALAPLGRGLASAGGAFGALTDEFVLRRTLIDDNRRLRREVGELRRRAVESWGLEQDLERLTEALDYAHSELGPLRAADVVFIDHRPFLRTLVVFVREGSVERNQPVVSIDGLVGRVVLVSGRYAKVQLVTDRSASVGAMLQRTRRQGIVRGASAGSLEFDFVPLQADVRVGDAVVSAGIDGIYPRGLPIGRVTEVEAGNELFHRIRLRPAVEFGVLDQVYVLAREPLPEAVIEEVPDAGP